MEIEIQEEELFFKGQRMTKEEIDELDRKKTLLRLARERERLAIKEDSYVIPQDEFDEKGKIDSKRQLDLLKARYDNNKPDDYVDFNPEQKEWETNRLSNAALKFGMYTKVGKICCIYSFPFLLLGAGDKPKDKSQEYDYVFEDQIAFIKEEVLTGSNKSGEISFPSLNQSLYHFDYMGSCLKLTRNKPASLA